MVNFLVIRSLDSLTDGMFFISGLKCRSVLDPESQYVKVILFVDKYILTEPLLICINGMTVDDKEASTCFVNLSDSIICRCLIHVLMLL